MTTFVDSTTLITAAFMNAVATVVEAAGPIAIAAVTPAADTFAYYTSAAAAASTPLTAFARTILDDANAAAVRTTLGLGTAATTAASAYATAAQGALADTAVQPANPAFTGTATFNSTYFVQRSDGHSGFGYAGAPEVFTANRRYVSIQGDGTGTSDGCGVLQFRSNSPDGTNVVGAIEFIDPNNTSGNKRVGYIANVLAAGTANNRGSYITIATRADAGAAAAERMRISSAGDVAIGSTVTGSGDRFRLGDGTSSSIMRLLGNSGVNGQAELKLTRDSISTWAIGYGGAADTNLTFALGPASDTEADLAAAALFTIDGFGLAAFGSYAPNTAKLLVSTSTSTPSTPIANSLAWFAGADSTAPTVGIESIASIGELHFRRANGTMAAKTGVVSGNVLGTIGFTGYTSAAAFGTDSATIKSAATETWSATAQGANLTFATTAPTTTSLLERMRIFDSGKVSMTTTNSTLATSANQAHLTVGAGTTAPAVPPTAGCSLHCTTADGTSSYFLLDSYGSNAIMMFRRANTSAAAPSAVTADQQLGAVQFRGYHSGAAYSTGKASFIAYAAENFTNTAQGTYVTLSTTAIGATTLTEQLRIADNGNLTLTSKLISYNGTTLTGNGVAVIVARSVLTAQSAAIATNTIYAVPASGAGHYRVSWVASITTAATTSSTLGGSTTTGFQLTYTDPTDSVVKTSNPVNVNNSVNTAANTTGTAVSGTFNAYCQASTNLQYSFGYTSVGATAMVFDISIVVEYLGA